MIRNLFHLSSIHGNNKLVIFNLDEQYNLNLTLKQNNVIGNVENNDLNNSTKIVEEHKIKLYEELYLKIEKLIKLMKILILRTWN